jgi:hypothetical protein
MTTDLSREQLLLVALHLAKGEPLSPVQLQKSLFLLQAKLPQIRLRNQYNFVPYDYGPFCGDIYKDAELLQDRGLVRIFNPSLRSVRYYQLTPKGQEDSVALAKRIDDVSLHYAGQLIEWVRNQSFRDLLSAIYQAYPEYKASSVFGMSKI